MNCYNVAMTGQPGTIAITAFSMKISRICRDSSTLPDRNALEIPRPMIGSDSPVPGIGRVGRRAPVAA